MDQIEKMMKRAALARGDRKVSLVLRNCRVVNVFNGKIIASNIGIDGGKIIGVGDYQGEVEVDLKGQYVAPGLIDAHMHLESTLVTPDQLARIIVPRGTTTVVADPHEIANVLGLQGIQYMLDATENTPLNGFFMLPSCVPATPFENAGAILDATALSTMTGHPRVLGLGEMMNYPGVIQGERDMIEKLAMADRMMVDGHGPAISGKSLNAYVINGIRTEHECTTLEEMQERIGLGMYIAIREGSAARNLEALIAGVNDHTKQQCMFCSDDKHPEDLLKEGHIDHNVRMAIRLGVDPITAIQMGTINAARCYQLRDIGAIAPGYDADLIVFDNFQNFNIQAVYKRGERVAEDLKPLFTCEAVTTEGVVDTVKIGTIRNEQFTLPLKSDVVQVIRVTPGSILTEAVMRRVYQDAVGNFQANSLIDVVKIAVVERHGKTDNIGIGLVENFHLRGGAIATSISHDSHNIIVVGDSDSDMALAVNHLKHLQGGIVVVANGIVCGALALPIAGLMSPEPMEIVSNTLYDLRQMAISELGIDPRLEPFMTLSFLALPVIPALKITDRGLFDVNRFEWVNINP